MASKREVTVKRVKLTSEEISALLPVVVRSEIPESIKESILDKLALMSLAGKKRRPWQPYGGYYKPPRDDR